MRQVHIKAQRPDVDITVQMGNGPATLTGGLGGWTVVERVDDIGLTDWVGQEPLSQDVPLLLDGWGVRPDSVERELNTILKLARDSRPGKDREPPPVFKLYGPVHFEGKAWVLPDGGLDLDTESTIRTADGTLVRQAVTLHCLEYVKPETIRRRHKGGVGKKPSSNIPLTYGPTKQGDTFLKVANHVYEDWERWQEIARKNPKYPPQPLIPIPPGRTLNL